MLLSDIIVDLFLTVYFMNNKSVKVIDVKYSTLNISKVTCPENVHFQLL